MLVECDCLCAHMLRELGQYQELNICLRTHHDHLQLVFTAVLTGVVHDSCTPAAEVHVCVCVYCFSLDLHCLLAVFGIPS